MKLAVLFVLTHVFALTSCAPVLKLVILLFRHGDRSPSNPYHGYTHESYWPQGLGQLTILGMQQQYALGEFIKQRYIPNYLSSAYKRVECSIRSSDIDRTIMSALAQLSAIFPPTGEQVWNSSLLWQPIPVFALTGESSNILRSYSAKCPALTESNLQFTKGKQYKDASLQYKDLFKNISDATNSSVSLTNIWQYSDTTICDKAHNLTLAGWAQNNYEDLIMLNNWNLKAFYARKEIQPFISGRLMSYFWELVNACMNSSADTKAYFLSAHDITLMGLLSALNVWNDKQPPYASLVISELFQDGDDWYLQFSYKNSTADAVLLSVPGCNGSKCPVEDLKKLTQNITLTEGEWEHACGLNTVSLGLNALPYIIGIAVLGLIIVFLCCVVLLIIPCKRITKPKYEALSREKY